MNCIEIKLSSKRRALLRNHNKMIYISVSIILVLIIAIYYFNRPRQLYGNDEESIIQIINSIEGYEDKEIEIIDSIDFENDRIVGFLSDNSPGYIQFIKNESGDYRWQHIEVNQDGPLGIFLPNLTSSQPQQFMFVANSFNDIAKVQITVNGGVVEQTLTPYEASVDGTPLPEMTNGEYRFDHYQYFDADGNIINR